MTVADSSLAASVPHSAASWQPSWVCDITRACLRFAPSPQDGQPPILDPGTGASIRPHTIFTAAQPEATGLALGSSRWARDRLPAEQPALACHPR